MNATAEVATKSIDNQRETTAVAVVESPSLASSIGLGDDVHFSVPRNFRVGVFNTERVDVEASPDSPTDQDAP